MTDIKSIYMFYYDPIFSDPSKTNHTVLETTGISKLNQLGLSYFVDLHTIKDTRDKTKRPIDWVGTTIPFMLVDNHYYNDFTELFNNSTIDIQNSIFYMIDLLFFNKKTLLEIEKEFTTSENIKDLYVAGSVVSSTTLVSDIYYINNQQVNYTTNPSKSFSIKLVKDKTTYLFNLNIIVDGEFWNNKYPNTLIQKISPPVSYERLLNMDFVREISNSFTTASTTAGFIGGNILPGYSPTDIPSGYINHTVMVRDKARNQTLATFTIIYKGCKPTTRKIRDAIRDEIVNSGVGTEDDWKDRIPELFISATMFLVPMWDNIIPKSDKTLYPGSLNLSTSLMKVKKVLYNIDAYIIQNKTDVLIASYNKLFLLAIPEDYIANTNIDVLTFSQVRPDYQAFSTTEPNFSYMSKGSQQLGICLTDVLSLLNENKTSSVYHKVSEGDLEYISFTIEEIEYCVITQDSYNELIFG